MSYTHFSSVERHELSILRKKGYSVRAIAQTLGRHPSSVSRELRRNRQVRENQYVAPKAQVKAYVRRRYSKYQGMKVRERPELEAYVKEKLSLDWSPEQVAGRWNRDHAKKQGVRVSAKGIYKWCYSVFGCQHAKYLKYKHPRRQKRKQKKQRKEMIKNRVSIELRPNVVSSRRRYGDFEGDTMGRSKHASAETLVVLRERKSRFILAKKVPQLKYSMDGFKELLSGIPLRSVTFDNGVENVRHEELGVPTYFAHPYSSWEKGSVENGIGVVREYIPKKSDLASYTEQDIVLILDRINNTPMKCLDYQTPLEVFEGRFLKRTLSTGVALDG